MVILTKYFLQCCSYSLVPGIYGSKQTDSLSPRMSHIPLVTLYIYTQNVYIFHLIGPLKGPIRWNI